MKKLLLAAALAFSLAGCATLNADIAEIEQTYSIVTTATVPAATAQIAVSSFQVIESAATQYFVYCGNNKTVAICSPGTVANPGPLRIAIKYDQQGRSARDQIKAAGKSGALISATTYNLLVQAVTNLTATPVSAFGGTK